MSSNSSTAARESHQSVRRVLSIRLPATSESVPLARRTVCVAASELGIDEVSLAHLKLVVTEACANVVRHAYPIGRSGDLELELWVTDGPELGVVVRDFGSGMRPRLDSPGLGLGLPLMAALTDAVDVRNTGSGTDVELRIRPVRMAEPAHRATLHERISRVATRAREVAQDVTSAPLRPGRETA